MKPVLLALALGVASAPAAELFLFQLPWDDATPSATNVSFLNDKPAGGSGFITVKDGHLFAGDKRFRIFGVNTCFAADFPDKDLAPKVAARMAKFGINGVRFHHMDMRIAPDGIFAKDGKTLDAGQLDKLDWFIAKLKENGIYADLNLHVSRTYPDRPRDQKKGNPEYDKGVDNYCAAMIALQKDYARDLLTHVNPYTGKSYADEPAVALVEINNENSLGFEWWAGLMDELPEVYRQEWETLWSKWIGKKYQFEDTARTAWSEGRREAGVEQLAGPGCAQLQGGVPPDPKTDEKSPVPSVNAPPPILANWFFEQHEGAVAKGSVKDDTITFAIEQPGKAMWHCQFGTTGLPVHKDMQYEVRFRVRAPKETSISVTLMQSHAPWQILGSTSAKAGPEWRDVSAVVRVKDTDYQARLTIGGMGLSTGTFEFSGFSLRTAAVDGGLTRDAAGRVPIIKKSELSRYTDAKQRDWQEFIWDTEIAYWNGMRDFLKKDLGVHAPIVGTQGFWSPGHVQAGMDVIDSHAYWHHPDFQGRGWNADVWTVKNESMAGAQDGGTLAGLAAQRVAGKPFICTEYNESAPNSYGAETFPLVLSFAALQDWDGIFAFSYSHRGGNEWGQEYFNNFFDIDRHPVKMATLPGAVISFRRGDVEPAEGQKVEVLRIQEALDRALKTGPQIGFRDSSALGEASFKNRIGYRIAQEPVAGSFEIQIGHDFDNPYYRRFKWSAWTERMQVDSKRSNLFVGSDKSFGENPPSGGHPVSFGDGSSGDPHLSPTLQGQISRHKWACYQLTVLDGTDMATAKRILITATGDIENTGMTWKNVEKSTVGRDWGKAPVLVEGPEAQILLPGVGKLRAWALDECGQRRTEIPITGNVLDIGPQRKTLWYEVTRE